MPFTDLSWRLFRPAEGFYSSEVQSPSRLPVRTFLPTGYEPNYAYPLLVFFHGHGGNEEQVLRLAPRLSRRNYICIGLRGTQLLGERSDGTSAFSWGTEGQADALIEDYVLRAVEQTRRNYHVHSERIYLAGFCEGAPLAYRLSLNFAEKFAGVISLNARQPVSAPARGSRAARLHRPRHCQRDCAPVFCPRRFPAPLHCRARRPPAHLPGHAPAASGHAARHQPVDY